MKFQKGETVVCIDNIGANYLKLHKKYTAYGIFSDGSSIVVKIDNDKFPILNTSRFISLDEHRRNKILKVQNEISKRRHGNLY